MANEFCAFFIELNTKVPMQAETKKLQAFFAMQQQKNEALLAGIQAMTMNLCKKVKLCDLTLCANTAQVILRNKI